MRWIKLDTSITQWEWFQEPNTFRLWIYLIINANYKDVKFMGMTLRRGQHIQSTRKIADDMGVSQNTVLRSLNQLTESKCIVIENLGKMGSLITIVNYDKYQNDSPDNDDETPSASVIESHTESHAESDTESHAESRNRIEKEIYKEKEMRVTLARTWEEELKNDEMWTEQLAMRLKVTTEVVRNGISEATSTFIIDDDVPRDRQSYRIRTRQYIDSHLAKIIRPAADAVSEQTRRYADTKEDRGNRIDEHARRLHETLRATYEAIKSGAAAAERNAPI